MSLVPDYEDSSNSSKGSQSSSSSSSDSDEKLSTDSNLDQQKTKPIKLPTPSFLLTDNNNQENVERSSSLSSVFKNPYAEAENAKEAILQKHVKMVQNKNNVTAINGKHICWNYRKMGRCRFGHNCKYAHDSDLQINTYKISNADVEQNQQSSDKQQISKIITEKKEKRRKRPGLSDTLTPSKRVVKNYYKLKQQ